MRSVRHEALHQVDTMIRKKLLLIVTTAILSLVFISSTSFAQRPLLRPAALPLVELSSASVGKIYKNNDGISCLGLILYQRPVVKYQTEERRRDVKDPKTGEMKTESYTVQVPYIEESFTTKRLEIPLENVRFWTTDNQSVTLEEASRLLRTPTRCLSFSRPGFSDRSPQLDPFYSSLLDKELLIVWYDCQRCKEIPLPQQK